MTAKLLPLLPRHHTYVEPFGGGASLLFAKTPAPVEVYNDIDKGLVNFFRCLRDRDGFREIRRLARLTPYSRAEWNAARETWRDETDPIRRAFLWFVVARMSFSGSFGASWASAVTASGRGMAGTVSKWLTTLGELGRVHRRLMRVQIECADWRVILDRYDTPETLMYCDPPYVHGTRSAGGYAHEMTDADHAELVQRLIGLKGTAVLSGYANEAYARLEAAGWGRIDWRTACHAAARTRATGILGTGASRRMQSRIESVWLSPKGGAGGPLFEEATDG